MEASGWRLKGCGELKRGLKNYQQGRTPASVLPSPSAARRARRARGERAEEGERQREGRSEDAERRCKV